MAINTEIPKIRLYDWHHGCGCYTSVSYSTQRVGTGEDEGLASALTTASLKPGSLVDDVYVRTDLTTAPQVIQDTLSGTWDDAFHTLYEAYLRT